ncbi:MAG: hypothetical protein IJR68_04770 [Fretibacterium sp.]|nr:hypothetical protein [Fretibacterium sp.]
MPLWVMNGAGRIGANGKSAFELAQEAGFMGTLEEWLASLGASGGAGMQDAPDDGKIYARKNGIWVDITDFLTSDNSGNGDDSGNGDGDTENNDFIFVRLTGSIFKNGENTLKVYRNYAFDSIGQIGYGRMGDNSDRPLYNDLSVGNSAFIDKYIEIYDSGNNRMFPTQINMGGNHNINGEFVSWRYDPENTNYTRICITGLAKTPSEGDRLAIDFNMYVDGIDKVFRVFVFGNLRVTD